MLGMAWLWTAVVGAQVVDTLIIPNSGKVLRVGHTPLEPGTLTLLYRGKVLPVDSVAFVSGQIFLTDSLPARDTVFAVYKSLEHRFPPLIGPLWQELPEWSPASSSIPMQDPSDPIQNHSSRAGAGQILATGTVFRTIELSSTNGNGISGGLEMKVQGEVGSSMVVEGVLSDQNVPLQPEGNTATLQEIDQVYLEVSHPQFRIRAGDVRYQGGSTPFNRLERELTGLQGDFHSQNQRYRLTIGGNDGIYHTLHFFGEDQNQGPYVLSSREGQVPVVVVAGSEKVWVDGELKQRGENRDYIIDYSLGEITFMARLPIYFDTEIFIEYQYRDGRYGHGFQQLEATVSPDVQGLDLIGFQWVREGDQIAGAGLSAAEKEWFRHRPNHLLRESTARLDSTGWYRQEGGVFIFSPEGLAPEQGRFTITFQADPDSGHYQRKVSSGGTLYYEYVPDSLKSAGTLYYSPWHRIPAPERTDLVTFTSGGNWGADGSWQATLHGSSHVPNALYGGKRSSEGLGAILSMDRTWELPHDWETGITARSRFQQGTFHPLSNDRDVLWLSNWNLSELPRGDEAESSLRTTVRKADLFQGNLEWKQLSFGDQRRDRLVSTFQGQNRWMKEYTFNWNSLIGESAPFYQSNGRLVFLKTPTHPLIYYDRERVGHDTAFETKGFGVLRELTRSTLELTLDQRIDWMKDHRSSLDRRAAVSWDTRTAKGWTFHTNAWWRTKQFTSGSELLSRAGLAQGSFSNRRIPVRWDGSLRLEDSRAQYRTVVYDSVGPGLGQYRYDPVLEEYIPDPHGEYIGTVIFTGDRVPVTALTSNQRLEIRDGFLHRLPAGTTNRWMLEWIAEIKGDWDALRRNPFPDLPIENMEIARHRIRQEGEFTFRKRLRQVREWTSFTYWFTGLDPRGNEVTLSREGGVDLQWFSGQPIQMGFQILHQSGRNSSAINDTRNRNHSVSWIRPQLKWNQTNRWQGYLQGQWARGKGAFH
ncbi:MAG: hypothetical protein D6762_08060, partial [Candidatus Neomarinimicrobiota bacterium]